MFRDAWLRGADGLDELRLVGLAALEHQFQQSEAGRVTERAEHAGEQFCSGSATASGVTIPA
jgi:hypothetical protein